MAGHGSTGPYLEPQQMCDYVLLRHANVSKDAENEKLYKKWTRLWVVVHSQVSPFDCFLGYCKKESKWLQDNRSIVKYPLNDFTVSMMSTRKHDKVMKLELPSMTIELSFDSQTKMDHYFNILSGISLRHHVDLVRAPSHPDKEGDYIIQDCSESYKVWKSLSDNRGRLSWEWNLRTIRRIHYHRNVEKLEIEAGRSSETGEGHFYFTGRHAFRLFEAMKTELMARAQQKTQSQNKSLPSSYEPLKSNLVRSKSSIGDVNSRPANPIASNAHVHSSGPIPHNGHKPLAPLLSQPNSIPLPPRTRPAVDNLPRTRPVMDDLDTSSEEYSPSDNSSSFTGTGGSIQDWTTPSPVPLGGAHDRALPLPMRITDSRSFSPCSTSSSSSSCMSGYNISRRSYKPLGPPRQPQYMHVNRAEMVGDGDYMTMNPGHRRNQVSSEDAPDSGAPDDDEEEEDDEEDDYENTEEDDSGYTDMHSARTASSDFAEQYSHMVPFEAGQTATLTRSRPESQSTSTLPPPLVPELSSRLREIDIIESTPNSNTFPGTNRSTTTS